MNKTEVFPLVSIVMAAYNGERFLRPQLQSLVHQSWPNIEIVIVDDCSRDSTSGILRHYAREYKNIQLYRNETNIGYIKSFEKGIQLSRGGYIALCDQDDTWHPDKIKILMQHLGDESLVYCNSTLIDEAGIPIGKTMTDIKNLESYKDPLPFLIGNCISGHASIVKRDCALAAIPFPDSCPHDWSIAFTAACLSGTKFINEKLVQYRQHPGSTIGAVRTKTPKKNKSKLTDKVKRIRHRMHWFASCAGKYGIKDKEIILRLDKTYNSFYPPNDFKRMMLFFRYKKRITAIKKKSPFRIWLFCLKMFFKII